MAYSGAVSVMSFQHAESLSALTDAILDIGTDTKDLNMICPMPLQLYAFGIFVLENLGASYDSALVLQDSTSIDGTDTTISTLDLDSTSNFSGDGDSPLVTVSTGAEDIDDGDVVYSSSADFPYLVVAGRMLVVQYTASTDTAGEAVPFVVARWNGPDLRPTNIWARA